MGDDDDYSYPSAYGRQSSVNINSNFNDSDRKPLLSASVKQTDDHGHGHDGGSGAITAFFTMCTACAGAGILSLPLAVLKIGILAASVTIILFGAANTFTLRILADLTDDHRVSLEKKQFSYEQLVAEVLGQRWGNVSAGIILLTQFGSLVAYWVILLDLSVPIVIEHHWLRHISPDTLRAIVAFSLAIVIIYPLSFFKKIHSLAAVVVLAILSIVWTAGVVVYEGAETLKHHQSPISNTTGSIHHTNWEVQDWIATLPAIVFTFNCHQQLTPVYGFTAPASQGTVKYGILPGALIFCSSIYIITAIGGYLTFGDLTEGNVLKNFGDDTWQGASSKLLTALHVVLVYPVVLFPLLRALDSVFGSQSREGASKLRLVVEGVRNLVVVLATATLAVFLPNVQDVFGFVGGVLCSCSVFIFPCWMKLRSTHNKPGNTVSRVLAVLLLVVGWFLVGAAMYVSISSFTAKKCVPNKQTHHECT
eukprot:m.173900 g.173900  ORF g.173900 m.173900 type:complete len:478 (-) comp31744_c1_seq2:38-1471(-)